MLPRTLMSDGIGAITDGSTKRKYPRLSPNDEQPHYEEIKCCRLRQTTSLKNSAHTVRRQLFLRIDDNYFSRSTTITFCLFGGAKRSPPGGERSLPAARDFFLRDKRIRGGGKGGKPALGFPLVHPPSPPELWKCGNLARSWRDSQGARGKGGSLRLAFHAFLSPAISTAHAPFGFVPSLHAGAPPSPSAWFSACCFCLACSTR